MEKFILRKLSDIGTENPIVARLSIQTSRIVEPFIKDKKTRDEIYEILGIKIKDRIISCFKIYKYLVDELNKADSYINLHIDEIRSAQCIEIPSIIDLNDKCESFLYQAKSSLRDLCTLFSIFFNKDFSEPRFDNIMKWALNKFGEHDDLYLMIKQNHDSWISRIISMRNAVEHPGGYSGVIHITNIEMIGDYKFIEPKWGLNAEKGSSIRKEMEIFINNMLFFCEDLLMICLIKLNKNLPFAFIEIPEDERDPKCPMRIQFGMRGRSK